MTFWCGSHGMAFLILLSMCKRQLCCWPGHVTCKFQCKLSRKTPTTFKFCSCDTTVHGAQKYFSTVCYPMMKEKYLRTTYFFILSKWILLVTSPGMFHQSASWFCFLVQYLKSGLLYFASFSLLFSSRRWRLAQLV